MSVEIRKAVVRLLWIVEIVFSEQSTTPVLVC